MPVVVLNDIQLKSPCCREAAQQGDTNASKLVDYLVAQLQVFNLVTGYDVYPILALTSCLAQRRAKDGITPEQIAQVIAEAK